MLPAHHQLGSDAIVQIVELCIVVFTQMPNHLPKTHLQAEHIPMAQCTSQRHLLSRIMWTATPQNLFRNSPRNMMKSIKFTCFYLVSKWLTALHGICMKNSDQWSPAGISGFTLSGTRFGWVLQFKGHLHEYKDPGLFTRALYCSQQLWSIHPSKPFI